jgi:hypothetical protein
MDTADYNPHAQPLREAVNSLHEDNLRTDLSSLLVDYVPKMGFGFLNSRFERLQMCWNALVQHAMVLLEEYDEERQTFRSELPSPPMACPEPLEQMMERMRRVVEGIGWLNIGLPRENVIEPQLGYALRHLEMTMQDGRGCGHGLMGLFEIDRRE